MTPPQKIERLYAFFAVEADMAEAERWKRLQARGQEPPKRRRPARPTT